MRTKTNLLALLLFLAAPLTSQETISPLGHPLRGKIIAIDPGHAVLNQANEIINPGARARRRHGGTWERDVVLSVADKMVPLLEAQGAKVFLTRTAGNPWRYARRKQGDNRSRAILANVLQADVYVRLHCDWNPSRTFQGFTTYYYRWGSRPLAEDMNKALIAAFPEHRNNGIHRRSFVSVTATMPTVLVEMGVLSYEPEARAVAKDEFRNRLAQAVSRGVVGYFDTLKRTRNNWLKSEDS
jgi:N-acetylmuramoyl-L-alanine amidase